MDLEVIVPVRNEEANIAPLVERIHKSLSSAAIRYSIMFVDDHSTDNTVAQIHQISRDYPIRLLVKKGSVGKAYSVLEASRVASAPYLAMIDGDLQYPPEALPAMLSKLKGDIGVVVANRKSQKTSVLRKLGSKVNKFIFGKLLMGLSADAQSGLKVFRREILQHISERDVTPWTLDMSLLYTARELGFEIASVDIEFAPRINGTSKLQFARASMEIGAGALKLRAKRKKVYQFEDGLIYKKKRYTTHTGLPHTQSALKTFTGWQKAAAIFFVASFLVGLAINPFVTVVSLVALLTLIYFLDVIFGGFVLTKSLHFPPEIKISQEEIDSLDNSKLPFYTILCPLYREGRVLAHFIDSISKIDWPKAKLDVLLLLEEDDEETQTAAKNLDLPSYVRVLVVPHSEPKTKPKACNFGLKYARGEYVVIYDAEDHPDPLQLKKAYIAFQKVGSKTICLQSKLNYYNPHHNLLTRLFTAEYSLWFDVILPGLQSIETHIPLGGTSNHFRAASLKGVHAWDPFNVTEDCDLGIRLFKNGYKTAIIDSVTLEEANSSIKNWIRQRSRWIKGYLQTYLVHMRNPVDFVGKHGVHALLFQLIIGMRISFMLINPILWIMTISYFAARAYVGEAIEALYPGVVFYAALFSLIVGNFMYLYSYMIGAAKREHFGVIKYVFFIPLYWIIASIAAVIAAYQLIFKPHYWEKTHHGLHLDKLAARQVKDAARREKLERVRGWARGSMVGGGALVFSTLSANVMNFLYNAYLGRSVDLGEFGTVSLISSILAITSIFTGSFGKTVVYKTAYLMGKFKEPTDDFLKKVEKWGWVMSLVSTLLWLAAIPLLAAYFQTDILPFILFAPALSVGVISSVYSGYLWGVLKFSVVALLTFFEALVKLVFAIALVEAGFPSLVYASIPISYLVAFLISWFAVAKLKKISVGENPANNFSFGFFGTSILTKISSVAFLSFDVILAKHFLSPTEAGRYALLALSGKIVFFLGSLFTQFIVPVVSAKEGEGERSKGVFYRLLAVSLAASMLGLVVVGVFGDITLPLLFGENARGISQYSLLYGLAMVSFTVSSSIISYHQIKGHYIFPVLGILAAGYQVVAILGSPKDVGGMATAIASAALFQLVLVSVTHVLYAWLVRASWVLREFLGLFAPLAGLSRARDARSLRILILNWRDTKHVWAGGAEVYVHEIAKRWAAAGHRVTLFCGHDRVSPMNDGVDGVNVIRRGGFYTVYFWAFAYYVLRLRGKFDFVLDSENGVPFFSPLYSRASKVLLVHHVHQEVFQEHLPFPLSTFARFVESRLMPLVYKNQRIVTVSNSSKRELVKLGYKNSGNISIVSPAVEVGAFRRAKKTKHPSFIYMGRLKPYKNIDVLIRAFAIFVKKSPEAKLTIAGDGESLGGLVGLVNSLELNGSVEFLGRISERVKANRLARSWVAFQPSSFEGWGITVIEANAAGTPVVASNVSGLRDSVVDGVTGILVPAKNPEAIARVMSDLVGDRKFLRELSNQARAWAKGFSWGKTTEQLLTVLEDKRKTDKLTQPIISPIIHSE